MVLIESLVAVGSNLGDRGKSIEQAIELLSADDQIEKLTLSNLIETAPLGGSPNDPSYLNGAIRLVTTHSAESLHQRLIAIEKKLGRERNVRWASRTIDLDLVGFGNQIVQTESLLVPHPRMSFRSFVLKPLCEVASDWVHPQLNLSVKNLVAQLQNGRDQIAVSQEILPLVAVELKAHTALASVEVVPVFMSTNPKLSILLSQDASRLGPRLLLTESLSSTWRQEVRAAIQAVWTTT